MADEQIVTNIVAKSDFSNLIGDLNKVSSALLKMQRDLAASNKQLSSQIAVMNRSFEETMLDSGQYSKHFISLTSDVDKFGRQLDGGRLKLKDYFRVYQDHVRTSGGLIRDLAKQQVQLQNAVLQPLGTNSKGLAQFNVFVPKGLNEIKNKTAIARQELQIMNKVIQDGGIQLINWGKNTQWAGRQLTVGLTLPLAAFGKAAADAFRAADQELTRLTKVYGDIAGTSQEELGRVREDVTRTAKEISAAMGVSFTETIALAADIAATGKTGNELLGSIKETTRLAVLGEVDRQEAMKATLAIQSAFKQNTDQLAESINFLNAVENQTSTTLNDLVEAIPKAGPVIKGLGGSIQDLALYLTAMREGGINASEGANALKSGLASLINPTDVAVRKFKTLGIDLLGIVNSNAGNVTNTLLSLQKALDTLDPLQKQQAIEQLFGKFQFSRLNALFENLGKQGSQTLQVLDLMKASTSQLGQIADRELTAVTESASGRYRRAIESLRAELAGVGDQFLEVGTKLVNGLSGLLNMLQKLPEPLKNIMALGGIFTALVGPVIMLTGVLANFVGYIIKGYGHLKAFFKGGEGFKLLTPELIAAERAADLMSNTFYNDARAATVLRDAIDRLRNSLVNLETAAATGNISVSPTISTIGGGLLMPGMAGYRPVNPASPFVGRMASAHVNPRDPGNPATLFGLVPSSEFVNQKVGRNPQIFMEERLPNIPGLTSISTSFRGKPYDVSTGIVSSEAARYFALVGAMGVQTEREVAELKQIIKSGGAVTTSFIQTFDDILPLTMDLTQNAARQSAAIVAQLRAGKVSVEAARAQIIAINAALERDLGIAVSGYAASTGRSIDVTKIPFLNQPVVDPISGKPNMRALFREDTGSLGIMRALGRATRTRTLGAPYSIETTLPPRYNMGGKVFYNNGDQVPGPNVNADVVPAMLTPGEFVIRRDIAQQDPDGMRALNEGQAVIVPVMGANKGGKVPGVQYRFGGGGILAKYLAQSKLFSGFRSPGTKYFRASRNRWDYTGSNPQRVSEAGTDFPYFEARSRRSSIYSDRSNKEYGITPTSPGDVLVHAFSPQFVRRLKAMGYGPEDRIPVNVLKSLGIPVPSGATYSSLTALSSTWVKNTSLFNQRIKGAGQSNWKEAWRDVQWQDMQSLLAKLKAMGVPPTVAKEIAATAASRLNSLVANHKGVMNELTWGKLVNSAEVGAIARFSRSRGSAVAANRGGLIRGYNRGGMVPGYRRGGGVVRNNRMFYGDFFMDPNSGLILPTSTLGRPQLPSVHGGSFIPLSNVMSGGDQGVALTGGSGTGVSRGRMMGATALRFGTGIAGSMVGMQFGMLGALAGGLGGDILGAKLAGALSQSATKASLLERSLSFLKGRPFLGATMGAAGLGAAVLAVNNEINKHKNIVTSSFGVTQSTAEKLKLNYFDINDQLKEMRENYINAANTATAAMAGLRKVGFTGTNITAQELQQIKDLVKGDEGLMTVVESFNRAAGSEMPEKAANFKASLVSMGMSVEDANELLLAMIQLSNKAGMALNVLSNTTFTQIDDKASAASQSLSTFSKELAKGTDQTGEALNTALGGYAELENSLVNVTDNSKEIVTQGEAYEKIVKEISKVEAANVPIKKKGYEQIVAIHDEMKGIVNETDTFASVLAKTRIAAAGLAVDLKGMAGATAQAISLALAAQRDVLTSQSGPLAVLVKAADASNKNAENTIKKSQKTQDEYKKEIKLIQDRIKKIKEEADARRRALEEQQEDEDILNQIKKKQLEYQDALAVGDLSGASAAQIDLQGLINRQQRVLAERAITADEERRIKLEEDKIAALEKLIEGLDSTIGKAMEKIGQEPTDKQKTAQNLLDKVTDLAMRLPARGTELTKEQTAEIEALLRELRSAGYAGLADELGRLKRPKQTAQYGIQGLGFRAGLENIDQSGMAKDIKELLNLMRDGINIKNLPGAVPSLNVKPTTTTLPNTNTKTTFVSTRELEAAGVRRIYNGPRDTIGTFTGTEFMVGQDRYVVKAQIPYTQNYAVQKKAGGGAIYGPGTSTSDSIPILASNGEYMMSAAAVQNAGGPAVMDFIHEYFKNAPRMKGGGRVPSMGIPDPNQSFLNEFLFGTRYIGGNMKLLHGEVPFGPGSIAKIPGAFSKTFKNFDIEFTPGSVPDLKSFVGNWNGMRITLENYFDAVKSGASWPLITEHPAQVAGGAFNSLKAYEKGLGEVIGDLNWDPFSGVVSTLNVARKFQRQGLASEFWRIASGLGGPLSHSAARSVAGDSWARTVGGILPELKHLVPPMAGGGYINSSFMPKMTMPSYFTGIDRVPYDMIAKIHKDEMVVPRHLNPNYPNSMAGAGRDLYYVAPVINAAPGMDIDQLTDMATKKIVSAMSTAKAQNAAKIGDTVNMSRRYM